MFTKLITYEIDTKEYKDSFSTYFLGEQLSNLNIPKGYKIISKLDRFIETIYKNRPNDWQHISIISNIILLRYYKDCLKIYDATESKENVLYIGQSEIKSLSNVKITHDQKRFTSMKKILVKKNGYESNKKNHTLECKLIESDLVIGEISMKGQYVGKINNEYHNFLFDELDIVLYNEYCDRISLLNIISNNGIVSSLQTNKIQIKYAERKINNLLLDLLIFCPGIIYNFYIENRKIEYNIKEDFSVAIKDMKIIKDTNNIKEINIIKEIIEDIESYGNYKTLNSFPEYLYDTYFTKDKIEEYIRILNDDYKLQEEIDAMTKSLADKKKKKEEANLASTVLDNEIDAMTKSLADKKKDKEKADALSIEISKKLKLIQKDKFEMFSNNIKDYLDKNNIIKYYNNTRKFSKYLSRFEYYKIIGVLYHATNHRNVYLDITNLREHLNTLTILPSS